MNALVGFIVDDAVVIIASHHHYHYHHSIYLFIYSLFNDDFSRSDYAASNERMIVNNES
jgi:hypothetical protein